MVKASAKKTTVKKPATKTQVSKTKVVSVKPAAKVIENKVSRTSASPKTGVRLVKKVQTAEGWKRTQKKIHSKTK